MTTETVTDNKDGAIKQLKANLFIHKLMGKVETQDIQDLQRINDEINTLQSQLELAVKALREIKEGTDCHEAWYQTIARDALKQLGITL